MNEDSEEPSYTHNTGYSFEVRKIVKENIEGWYDGNNLNVQGNFYLPTEAQNLKGYCQNTEDERSFLSIFIKLNKNKFQ